MNVLKRVTLSLMSTVDKTVSRMEDHDALVSAKISTINQQIASSKVEVMKVEKQCLRLNQQMSDLQKTITDWEHRAENVMHEDREKALACLQRRNQCEAQLNSLSVQLQQQGKLKQDMQARLLQMQNHQAEIKQQQTQLRNRGSQAEIERIAHKINTTSQVEFDDVFDRWEEKVIVSELSHETANEGRYDAMDYQSSQDLLESEFLAQEQQASLSAQLDAMMGKQEKAHD